MESRIRSDSKDLDNSKEHRAFTAFLETEDWYLKAVELGRGEVSDRRLYVLIIRIVLQLLQILVVGHVRQPLLHGPNTYKDTKPQMAAFLKN
jgi:hypothetical protein